MRILQWLTFSARPLSVEEIAEVVAIDVARDLAFNRDEVLEDPLEVLDICSSLVTITANKVDRGLGSAQQIVALAHYSMQEYLVSDRIRQGSAKQYSMQEAECHNAIARGSLKYLIQFQQPLLKDTLEAFALAKYTAEFWSSHLQKTGDEIEQASQLAMSLMAKEEPAYLNWIQLHDPDRSWEGLNLKKSLDSVPIPLYYAALLGLSIVTRLLLDKGADVNAQGGHYGNALQAAAYGGHEQLLELLISNYSISRLQDYYGRTLLWWAAAGGNIATVETLINQHNIDPQAADRFGRKPSWIATKKGHGAISALLNGYVGETDKEQEASPKVSNDDSHLKCDVCTLSIPKSAHHYHCNVCAGGDWDVCEDCTTTGATCVELAHTLVERTMLDGVWVEVTS
ncbi:Ank-2 multi-domain protein [Pyrenophora tritici-repentis]|nr:Ank-2 multi-domain protein [Pyrenophora tritici-repentis]